MNFDIVALFETHITSEFCDLFGDKFVDFIFEFVPAVRVSSRGRAKEGCLLAFKKTIKDFVSLKTVGSMKFFETVDAKGEKAFILPYYINCTDWQRQYEDLFDGLISFDTNNVMV